MTDNYFYLVGQIILPQEYDFLRPFPQKGEFHECFIVITDKESCGGFHPVLATIPAAKIARRSLELKKPALVSGNIKTFARQAFLIATRVEIFDVAWKNFQESLDQLRDLPVRAVDSLAET